MKTPSLLSMIVGFRREGTVKLGPDEHNEAISVGANLRGQPVAFDKSKRAGNNGLALAANAQWVQWRAGDVEHALLCGGERAAVAKRFLEGRS